MKAYQSKVVTIHAMQFDGDPSIHEAINTVTTGDTEYTDSETVHFIKTLEGSMRIQPGDWLIQGTEGEFYPCKDSVFTRKYESKV